MSLSIEQRLDAYRFFAIAFGAAPGATYYDQLVEAYKYGLTTAQVVNIFTTKSQFTDIYPTTISNNEFANRLIENVVGTSASAAAKAGAKKDIVDALSIGWSRGDVVYRIFNNLANKPASDKDWADTAKRMSNQVEVAKFISEYWPIATEDIGVLRSALKNVTHQTVVNSVQAIKNIIAEAGLNLGGLTMLSQQSDKYEGGAGADMIDGGAGNDTIYGYGGNDVLIGGTGNDFIYGGWGQDYIEGGDGADRIELGANATYEYVSGYYDATGKWVYGYNLYYIDAEGEFADGGDGADTIYGGYGSDLIYGGEGADTIYGDGTYSDNRLYDSYFNVLSAVDKAKLYNDTLYGDGGKDVIYGGYGDDVIFGGEGDDALYSGDGNDYVSGDGGDDYIYSSGGSDAIFGGEGNDNIIMYYLESGVLAYVAGGVGNDSITVNFNGEGQKAKIEPGEGVDKVYVSAYNDSVLEIDLAETVQNKDVIDISWYSKSRPQNPVVINNFSLTNDKLVVDYFHIVGGGYSQYSPQVIDYKGGVIRNYIQTVNSTSVEWMKPDAKPASADGYGKGVFVINGAAAAAADSATVAGFLDPYGNNATYNESSSHIFICDIKGVGIGVYKFQDDTGANNRIVSDEIVPIAVLTGLSTSMLNPAQNDFFLI